MKWKERPSESYTTKDSHGERLKSLSFISVFCNDDTHFSILLTRVPCVGEIISNEGDEFRIVAVRHSAMTPSGKSRCGYVAHLDVELLSPEPPTPRRQRPAEKNPSDLIPSTTQNECGHPQ